MPDYTSLQSQIDGFKSELTAAYASGQLTSKELIYVAKALESIGGLLGVSDITTATADKIIEITSAQTTALSDISSSKTTALSDISTSRSSALNDISTSLTSALNQITSNAAQNFHPFMFLGV